MAQFNKIKGYFTIKTGENTSVETSVILSRLDFSGEGIRLSFYSAQEFGAFEYFIYELLPVSYLMEIDVNCDRFCCTIPTKFITEFEIK